MYTWYKLAIIQVVQVSTILCPIIYIAVRRRRSITEPVRATSGPVRAATVALTAVLAGPHSLSIGDGRRRSVRERRIGGAAVPLNGLVLARIFLKLLVDLLDWCWGGGGVRLQSGK